MMEVFPGREFESQVALLVNSSKYIRKNCSKSYTHLPEN
jgi:hypothetical protein